MQAQWSADFAFHLLQIWYRRAHPRVTITLNQLGSMTVNLRFTPWQLPPLPLSLASPLFMVLLLLSLLLMSGMLFCLCIVHHNHKTHNADHNVRRLRITNHIRQIRLIRHRSHVLLQLKKDPRLPSPSSLPSSSIIVSLSFVFTWRRMAPSILRAISSSRSSHDTLAESSLPSCLLSGSSSFLLSFLPSCL